MIPRVVIVLDLEAAPVLRVESQSAEDEAAVLAWADGLDVAEIAAAASERIAVLRESRAA